MGRRHEQRVAGPTVVAVAVAAVAVLASCTASLGGGARDAFARDAKCPADQTTVVSRPEHRAPPRPSLPDETGDPGTLAYWQKRQSGEPRVPPTQDVECETFEVTGCGQRAFFCCHHPLARDSSGVLAERAGVVECEPR